MIFLLCCTVAQPVTVGRMFCKTCRQFEKFGSFSTGSTKFKHENIKAHENSLGHQKWTRHEEAKKAPLEASQAVRAVRKMNEANFKRNSYLFRNAHAIAKQIRPFIDYEWQYDLDQAKGLHIGTAYHSRKNAPVFIHYIAKVQRRRLVATCNAVSFVSVITDGTTDSSVTETEMVYMRFATQGNIRTHFVGVYRR